MKGLKLTCDSWEYVNNLDNPRPQFSWQLPQTDVNLQQSAYQIILEYNTIDDDYEEIWNTGKIQSDININVPCGVNLPSETRYRWKVNIWDQHDTKLGESDFAFFETGLMIKNWKAKWIGYDKADCYDKSMPFYCADNFDKEKNTYYLPPLPYLRKQFTIDKKVKSAKIYISALGILKAKINGFPIAKNYFVPGFTDYKDIVYSYAYDVTNLLNLSDNVIGLVLADGWYAGYIGLNSRQWYGDHPRAAIQLQILYTDGTSESLITDETWKANYGAYLYGDIMQGEGYDATKAPKGWSTVSYDDSDWENVIVDLQKNIVPTGHIGEPVVMHNRIKPKQIFYKGDDRIIIDFGKYISGVISIKVKGNKGSKIIINHSEILDNGEMYPRANRSAKAEDIYILNGKGEETYAPQFTYHGFQFAEIRGLKNVKIIDVQALSIGSKIDGYSKFECSSKMINNVYEMVKTTQKSNTIEVPTDCSARDERLGWGAEGNQFLGAMARISNQEKFIRKWARDIWKGQHENGGLEAIAPVMVMKDVEQFIGDLQSNHGIHMVYILYTIYGDLNTVKKYYNQMKSYMGFLQNNSDRYLRIATAADWLGLHETTGFSDLQHGYGDCSQALIGTAHYGIIILMMIELAAAIGKTDDVSEYTSLYEKVKKAFELNFIQRDGTLRNGKQAEYLLGLEAGFFGKEDVPNIINILVEMITRTGEIFWKGGTASTPYFLSQLKNNGLTYLANRFLNSEHYPSIGYMQKMGATSIWERWDAIYPDGRFHPHAMNAFSHIGHTVVGQYLVDGILGIIPAKPGFKKINIKPGISNEITWASGDYKSVYGNIEVDWSWKNNKFVFYCSIPSNTTAKIFLPIDEASNINTKCRESCNITISNEVAIVELLSGKYEFSYRLINLPENW